MLPHPSLTSSSHSVALGHPLTLPCQVEGQPPPTRTWYHFEDSREIPITDTQRFLTLEDGSLFISSFVQSDFNQDCITVLLCFAENAYGQSRQFHTIRLENGVCTTEAPPTLDPNQGEEKDEQNDSESDQGNNSEETVLIAVFAFVLFCLLTAAVVVFIFLMKLCIRYIYCILSTSVYIVQCMFRSVHPLAVYS